MVSTMSHVYLTVTPTSLYADFTKNTAGTSKVAVSFPIWAFGEVVNKGTVAPNLVKVSVAKDNKN